MPDEFTAAGIIQQEPLQTTQIVPSGPIEVEQPPSRATTIEDLFGQTTVDVANTVRLKPVSPRWNWISSSYSKFSQGGVDSIRRFYGLSDDATEYRVFHGTKLSKLLQIVADNGMKPFPEPGNAHPAIYATLSPTLAVWHAEVNGPHDKARATGQVTEDLREEESVLLMIRIPRDQLRNNPEARRPLNIPEWIKEAKGINGDRDDQLVAFEEAIDEEVTFISRGEEPSDFGFPLPIQSVPLEYIFVVDGDTHEIKPITQHYE